jgi:hypothetical protein
MSQAYLKLSFLKVAIVATLAALISASAIAQTSGTCPASGLTTSTGTINLTGNCQITGAVNLSGTATLTMTNGTLSIAGNVVLNNQAALTITDGSLNFPQTNYSQFGVTLNGTARLTMNSSTVSTNGTQQNNFSMALNANDSSVVEIENSSLNIGSGSWLLGNFNNNSTLTTSNSQNLPTEIYPADASQVSISGSRFATTWLDFPSGSIGALKIPAENSQGDFSLNVGPGNGMAYSVDISESQGQLGLGSYPNSTIIVDGDGNAPGVADADVVLGYYIQNNTGPVNVSGLRGGNNVSLQLTDQGRNLQLNHVNLDPFAWEVYVAQSNNYPVSVTNSIVNEIAAFTNGLVNVSNCVAQLAFTGAVGPGSIMNVDNCEIWSQVVVAENGGQLTVMNSELYGNIVTALGSGSKLNLVEVGDNPNGTPPQTCAPNNGSSPNNNGVPLCDPFNPLYQCVQVIPSSGGATITSSPNLTCSSM